jgi:GNAT superfamily N-acetyltransferase
MLNLRPVLPDDLPDCIEVFYLALDELHQRLGQPSIPRNPEAMVKALRHLVTSDPAACWLAEENGLVKGFGMAHRRDDHWYLGFLFVHPAAQSRGIGRALLEVCLRGPDPERVVTRRSVVVEAIQPVSTALYAQYGMLPRVPLYLFTGEIRQGSLPEPEEALSAAGLEAIEFGVDVHVRDQVALDALDREVVGWERHPEHEFLATADRRAFLYRRGGADAGYGYVQRSGRVGPVCARTAADLGPITAHLLGSLQPPGAWQVIVPGTASGVFVPLLRAGLRIDGPPAIFCASWPGPAYDRYLPINFAYG